MKGIQQRGENSYFFTVSLGRGADGKYKRKTKTIKVEQKMTPKQKEEYVKHEYMKFKQEVLAGNYIKPDKMSFTVFVEEWKEKFVYKELAETTIAGHLSIMENHIKPVIGHLRMDQINTMMLIDLMDNVKKQNGKEGEVSPHTRESVYKTLKSVFKYAKRWQVIKHDPMDGVSKPKIKDTEAKEVNVYDEQEVAILLEKAQEEPFHWRIFITLALTAGLRRGENLGLEWSLIDLEKGILDVKQTITRGRNGAVIKPPKANSQRLISLPPSVVEELKRYKLHWKQEKLKLGDRWKEDKREWIYCNTDGRHFYPTTPTTWWNRFTERTGVRHIRLHDLRHTSATLLIAQGVHAKIISERLGHSDIKITMNTYGHALRSADEAAANTFEGLFNPQSKTQ
jgi:integrase